jgi:hypothetical protein
VKEQLDWQLHGWKVNDSSSAQYYMCKRSVQCCCNICICEGVALLQIALVGEQLHFIFFSDYDVSISCDFGRAALQFANISTMAHRFCEGNFTKSCCCWRSAVLWLFVFCNKVARSHILMVKHNIDHWNTMVPNVCFMCMSCCLEFADLLQSKVFVCVWLWVGIVL